MGRFRSVSRSECGRIGKRTREQRGQTLVLFVLLAFVMIGSVAIVTDVSWFWVNQQRMQRAADAGALAGAVFLPGNIPGAYAAARAATTQNGYTNGVGGVSVTPIQDASNKRRLAVSVSGPVSTYFARVFGMSQVNEGASARAEFTLPVPMGSPQNFYGVGTFIKNTITTNTSSFDSGWKNSSTASGASWASTTNAYTWNNSTFATTSTANAQLTLSRFGLQAAVPSGDTIDGLKVQLGGRVAAGSSCQFTVDLSWNNGTNWSTAVTGANLTTTNTVLAALGSTTSTSAWGAHAWVSTDFGDASFLVRVTYIKGTGCTTASLDGLQVEVTSHHTTTTTTTGTAAVPAAPDGSTPTTQGFWGAVITRGGSKENGDEFSPANDNASIAGHTSTNAEFDASGYDYAVIINGSNGKVALFDPTFCETGSNGSGGNLGAGDHWIAGSANAVTTVYSLWNENGTPYSTGDDTLVTTSGDLFAGKIQADYSGVMGTPAHSGLTDCGSDPYHNQWWTLASGLSAGRYRLNVNTSSTSNNSTNAENMWSAEVSSTGGQSQIYGEARMCAYNNLTSGAQLFYLAQIDRTNAGKTMEITLFDPGDVSGNAYLRILSPNGNAYNYATFTYTADNGRSGTNVTQIQTASSGGSLYNDATITIDVTLPSSYGSVGLTPPGEAQGGWWKIEYTVSGGNDTTTWQVAIRGSPVHLVP